MSLTQPIENVTIDPLLINFIENEALPGTGVSKNQFWAGFHKALYDLSPKNHALLEKRTIFQKKIDKYHIENRLEPWNAGSYEAFLRQISYIMPEGPDFKIETRNVDPEIATIAGSQLVVPVTNARFALNAANARWGSLYDALYGTDALGTAPSGKAYDAERGTQVVAYGRAHLNKVAPLADGVSWSDLISIYIEDDALVLATAKGPAFLKNQSQYSGYACGTRASLKILLKINDLHLQILQDKTHQIGSTDPAGISDIVLEAAISTIMDCEDSVACVDGADKVQAYRNWLGLMRGDLVAVLDKNGESMIRRLNEDEIFTSPKGQSLTLKGRSLMLVRNVGHLMSNPIVTDLEGNEAPEGLIDAFVTVLCAMHDLRKTDGLRNSMMGSVYVVKPKLHGPEEVEFTEEIFSYVETTLGLPANTIKLGIMDEERRTSVNLKACICAASHRLAFINTGFLDRTGDEIHTSMEAGPMLPKGQMKTTPWIASYEDRNVDIGLECGLQGRAQIGKGMWAMPDQMANILSTKIGHPQAGASCAWVPSPTAAVLHATHYHLVNVTARQKEITHQIKFQGHRASLCDLLTPPLTFRANLPAQEIQFELENNIQGILGYVVRWIDQGIGCSKVPDVHNVGLMEDRATCRISAQGVANWLHHGVVSQDQVIAAFEKMAEVVDGQNAADPIYVPMAPSYDGHAYKAAQDLVLLGRNQPSGYTEPVLHARRILAKASR
ncbi:MAG: malate synthase G [Paracoccaceae bacterium]